MFALTIVDHLRLTFGHVIYTHRAHTQLALRHARWNRGLQGAEVVLMLAAALLSFALVFTGQAAYAMATAIVAAVAVCTLVVRLVLDLEGSVRAHRACAARLWHIREQYRALLADMKDGGLDLERARARRDELMLMLRAAYESAPPADRGIYEAARRGASSGDEATLTDEEVDQFLPGSLQKRGASAA